MPNRQAIPSHCSPSRPTPNSDLPRVALGLCLLILGALSSTVAAAGPLTCPNPILSIADIQSSVDPGAMDPDASLCVGQTPTLTGIVYAVYPAAPAFAFADATGPWNGIYVYSPTVALPAVGDQVTVTGTVSEYFGVTEITADVTGIGSSGNPPYAPSVVSTLTLATGQATAEAYEGVFVEVQSVEIVDDDLGFGEWAVDDGSGPTRVDDLGSYCYHPLDGETLDVVRGMLYYSYDDFKIQPATDCDFLVAGCSGAASPRSIAQVQGSGFVSPEVGTLVSVQGEVTGLFEGNYPGFNFFDGFFVQDPVGDANPATSEGLFVISDTIPTIGDTLQIEGFVSEFGEFDGTGCAGDCVTMVCALAMTPVPPLAGGGIPPEVWTPPTDTDGLYEYHEAREGMLVTIPGSATVVGPSSFGALFVVDDALNADRVLRGSSHQGKQVGVRNWEALGEINGSPPDDLIVGSTVENVTGPLTFSFGDPLVITQAVAPWSTVSSVLLPTTPPTWNPAPEDRFSVATLNVHNLDDGDTTEIEKLAQTVGLMQCPTFLALQEVDTESDLPGDGDEVLTAILSALAGEGCNYDSAYSHPDVGDHGVALLWSLDRVTTASAHSDLQGCSTAGSSSSTAYDSYCDSLPGEFPLFSRRPVVVTATLDASCGGSTPLEVVLIANHFKSQLGGAPADQRRLEQGQLVASAVDTLLTLGNDHILVLGDLNDFEDSPPVVAMTGGGLLNNLWSEVPSTNRYSYIFSGVSQVLDHQLASSELHEELLAIAPLHLNSDYPSYPYGNQNTHPWALSDHDPVVATFSACLNSLLFADGFESGDTTAW